MIASIPFLLAAMAATAPSQSSRLVVENCDAGEIYAFNAATCEIVLSNNGDKPIRVTAASATVEGDSVEPRELNISPHAHAYLKVRIDSADGAGYVHHAIRFRTDERGFEERQANATAFVMTVLDAARPQMDFGVVNAAATKPARKSIELGSHDLADFRIAKIIETPAWLDASIEPDGHTLTATVKPDTGWGLHDDFLKVEINAPQQSQAWVEVKADIHGAVVPSSNPYDMSLMRIGAEHEFHIPLRSRSGRAFQIGKIDMEGLHGTTSIDRCETPGDNCRMLILRVTDQQPGPIRGHVWIELPEFHQRLNLAVWGLLVPSDLKIKTIDPEAMLQNPSAGAGQSKATRSIDLQHALKEVVDDSNPEPPVGEGPLLKWTVANGLAIHGFQIFRAGEEAGPFLLLNPKTIASRAKTADSINYQYRDNTAKAGKTYWYYIGIVYNDGRKQQLSGPQKVVAK